MLCCLFLHDGILRGQPGTPTTLRFAVSVAAELGPGRTFSGRLLVVLGRADGVEPRLDIGHTGMRSAPMLGHDVAGLAAGKEAILDDRSIIFPIEHLGSLSPGIYAVQALLHSNPDLNVLNAPDDLYSPVKKVKLDPANGGTIALELSRAIPDETLPPDTEMVRYVKIRSRLLTEFHRRPIFLRAGVILPRNFRARRIGAILCECTSVDTGPGSPQSVREWPRDPSFTISGWPTTLHE